MLSSFRCISLLLLGSLVAQATLADEPSPAAPLMKLLQSGRLPKERVGTVVEMVCQKGNAQDLAFVFEQVQKPDAFPPKVRLKVLELLTDAALVRKVRPAGDLAPLQTLLEAKADPQLKLAAVKLASIWNVKELAPQLQALASSDKTDSLLRAAAIDGLANLNDDDSRQTLTRLAKAPFPIGSRIRATAALARVNLDEAVQLAGDVLTAASPQDDLPHLVDAILGRQGGAEKLAAALAGVKLPKEVAKVTLRYMYSVGRSDQELSNLLSLAAEISLDAPPPTQEEVLKIAAEVAAKGDAARGEKVFRRADVNCQKCHALARAGGQVGPELTALGSISPPEYIVNSILNPSLNIKEQYVTKVFLTTDGEVVTGILVDRNDERVRLKDASGKLITLASDDIEGEKEGPSLMPQGLTKFLTHQEFLDLAQFVSQLGRPGPYAIRTLPTMQRWRVLQTPSPALAGEIPSVDVVRDELLGIPAERWLPAYGKIGGTLPLGDVRELIKLEGAGIVWLQGEIDVSQGGEIQLDIHFPAKGHLWVDAEPFELAAKSDGAHQITLPLTAGRHKLTFRLPLAAEEDASLLRVEVQKPAGSGVQFDVVGGQ